MEQNKFSAKDLETFQTAVQYQMIHALGLILIGLLGTTQTSGMLDAAGWTMLVGILFFPVSFMLMWQPARKLFAMFVPIGGVAFILAWLGVAVAAMRR